MNLSFLEEPELEFGAGRHIDIRFGITDHGPLDFDSALAPRKIPIGIIGSAETIEGVSEWLERCSKGIDAKTSNQPNLFCYFPGCSESEGFRASFVTTSALCRDIPKAELTKLSAIPDTETRIRFAVDLFVEEIRYITQNAHADVIICAVPLAMLEAMHSAGETEDDDPPETTGIQLDFHDLLKARAMQLYRKPIQLILPSTYDEQLQRKQTRSGHKRTLQDEATRAWNIHTALYYKSGGVPWRLERDSSALTVCYVGINFYYSLDKNRLLSSVAQVFNERGEGVVVRGGAATISKEDRQPHLPDNEAYDLLRNALKKYREVHKNFPARLVIHKSSRFDAAELDGFKRALADDKIDDHDFLSLSGADTKLFRLGQYPPLRGSLLILDDTQMILYTRGSVDFFETYPGLYVPVPLRIRCESVTQTQKFLARELLALTKMNWNNTQFDGWEPVTLRAARQCSSVLRYCSDGLAIEPRYSFYM